MMRFLLSYRVVEEMRRGASPTEAAEISLRTIRNVRAYMLQKESFNFTFLTSLGHELHCICTVYDTIGRIRWSEHRNGQLCHHGSVSGFAQYDRCSHQTSNPQIAAR